MNTRQLQTVKAKTISCTARNLIGVRSGNDDASQLLGLQIFLLRCGGWQNQRSAGRGQDLGSYRGFFAASLCAMGIDKVLMKKDKSQQEKICLCTLIVTSVIAFILGVFYVCKNPYYPVGDQINTTAFAAYCRDGNFSMLSIGGYVGMYQQQKVGNPL